MHKKLAIVTTHPIQYYAPIFRLLGNKLTVKVFYTAGADFGNRLDKGFRKKISWDIPLLDGYEYQFLTNIAPDPGTHHFNGIVNTDAISALTNYQPDALLIFGWANHSHLKILRHFKGKVPIFFRGDSTLLDVKKGLKNISRFLFLSWVYRHVDVAFYPGQANKRYCLKFGIKEKNLVFAPHAIDNKRFGEDRDDEVLSFRSVLKLANTDILILFAGKLEPKKNPLLLFNAFAQLDLPNTYLLFVGNGVLETELKEMKQQIYTTNLASRIHLMDFQNQSMMPVVYQSADLFCLPSKGPGETWGLAVNEAMAAGKAILVSDKVGCAEDLVTTDCGMVFHSEAIEDLKQKLLALTTSRDKLVKMGKNSKKKIQNWSFEEQVKSIVEHVIS